MKNPKVKKLVIIGGASFAALAAGGVGAYLIYKQLRLLLTGIDTAIGAAVLVLLLALIIWMSVFSLREGKKRNC